jgi:NTP pyrophosphatase (non-canonical NTP hydrolase)
MTNANTKAVYDAYDRAVTDSIAIHGTIPHCDSRILHPLGTCAYCDVRPELHEARRRLGINYTGAAPDPQAYPCPAEAARPLATIEKWGGNRRETSETAAAREHYYGVELPAALDALTFSHAVPEDYGCKRDSGAILSSGWGPEAPLTISQLQKDSARISKAHGFWDEVDTVDQKYTTFARLCMIHSEVSEAMEAVRKGHHALDVASELADIVIRVCDLAEFLEVDLSQAISTKQAINETRPFKHGGKLL